MLQAPSLRQPQQGEQVLQVGVDAAVGQQAHQVQGGPPFPAVLHGLQIGRVLEELPAVDVPADVGQVLEYHPARADVGVAHLAVAPQAGPRPGRRQTGGTRDTP